MKKLISERDLGFFDLLRGNRWDENEFNEVLNWLKNELNTIPHEYRIAADRAILVLMMMYVYGDSHDIDLKMKNEMALYDLIENDYEDIVEGVGDPEPEIEEESILYEPLTKEQEIELYKIIQEKGWDGVVEFFKELDENKDNE